MKFAIVIGHRMSRQGARSALGSYEWEWNIPLGGMVCGVLEAKGHQADLVFRPDVSRGAMTAMVKTLNDGGYDYIVSLHFNATAEHTARGHMVLHYPQSHNGERLAKACSGALSKAYPEIPDRGLWATKVNGGGTELYILTKTFAPTCLIESHFGDVQEEAQYATELRSELGRELGMAIAAL